MNHDRLLTAANPFPDPASLEEEAFSFDDVVDRLEQPGEVLVPTRLSRQGGRPAAVVAAAFVLVAVAIAGGAILLGGDEAPVGAGDYVATPVTKEIGEDFLGSASYNPFIGIQQSLVSQSNEPVFVAQISGEVAASGVYFRLITMGGFNGTQFSAHRPQVQTLDEQPWVDPRHSWNGPSSVATVDIGIERLRMDWLPTPVTPTQLTGTEELMASASVREYDGSLRIDGSLTFEGMRYSVEAEIPQLDLGALIRNDDGELTPLFASASAAGESLPGASGTSSRAFPGDVDRHLALPGFSDGELAALRGLAKTQTTGAGSTFEAGLMLESWLHSEAFAYSTNIGPGHESSEILAWLFDPESPNYRVGYTEQFTAAMAVLARTLDIPSRIALGFTPGERSPEQEDYIVVRDRNAHAWVELWVPQQGWMRFDPTPRTDAINLPTYQAVAEQLGFDLDSYLRR